jgi:lysophospholipase L1-like esterase
MPEIISHDATVLFTGDSITDCGRSTSQYGPLGRGYPFLLSSWLSALYPENNLSFFNTGTSGNRTIDLAGRWESDVVSLRPSLVSVLVGVNDTWRRFDRGLLTTVTEFSDAYRTILETTKRETSATIVLCEPFLVSCGRVTDEWRDDLNPKIDIVRALAAEFSAVVVPLSDIFDQAVKRAQPEYWARDGIHPTPAGHALIAQAWLKHVLDIGYKGGK